MAAGPDRPSDPRRRERRWAPVLIVAALLVVVAGGARSVADATAANVGPVAMGPVHLRPLEGWQVEGAVTPTFARLHKGPVILDVTVHQPVAGGPMLAAALYREQQLESSFAHLLPGAPEATVTSAGAPAAGFTYLAETADGVLVEGLVIVVDTANATAIFDARAPSGGLTAAVEDIRTMVNGATI
jgi:hypothetical protein